MQRLGIRPGLSALAARPAMTLVPRLSGLRPAAAAVVSRPAMLGLTPGAAQLARSLSSAGLVVPIIDLKSFEPSSKPAVAKEINKAAEEIGFITIRNHGVPQQVIKNVWETTQRYFDLPDAEKRKIPMTDDYPYGYSGFAEENLGAGYGLQLMPDLKETFCIGPYNPAAGMPAIKWPANPPEMKEHWLAYYRAMEQLSANLLGLFALALRLPENWFEDKITRHRSALRALNYPELSYDPKPNQPRAGAHTDYGSVTILLQDKTGGLQVKAKDGEWHDVPYIPDAYVINLGDLMQRWTNDRWVSTLHRVTTVPSRARRQSMAFFHNINGDQVVSSIPTCVDAEHPAKYKDVIAWEWLMEKHNASMKQEKQ